MISSERCEWHRPYLGWTGNTRCLHMCHAARGSLCPPHDVTSVTWQCQPQPDRTRVVNIWLLDYIQVNLHTIILLKLLTWTIVRCLNDLMSAHTQGPVSPPLSGRWMSAAREAGDIFSDWYYFGVLGIIRLWGWHDLRGRMTTCWLLKITWASNQFLVHSSSAKKLSSCSQWELQLILVLWRSIHFRFTENQVWISYSFWWKVNIKEARAVTKC